MGCGQGGIKEREYIMYHFFTEKNNISDKDIYIKGNDYNHIRNVLRMKPGDVISVGDGVSDTEYRCHIEEYTDEAVHCRLDFIKKADIELPADIYLFQGIPKSDKMDMIVQKAVELGVHEIIPVSTERAVVKYDEKKSEQKVKRWNTIAEAAAKQSKRTKIPEVTEVMTFEKAAGYADKLDIKLIPYELSDGFENTRELIERAQPGMSLGFFIGPEGGFSENEIKKAEEAGIIPVSLGKRILRTETAAMVVLSWLIYRFERD